MKIERFEDIEAWKKARELAGAIYKATRDGPIAKDFGFRDQIRRAAISVLANIAEGFGRRTHKDFAGFLYIARGSVMETVSHLYVALDQEYLTNEQVKGLQAGYEEIQKMLVSLIRYLENSPTPK
jgi:four helix bundle protein